MPDLNLSKITETLSKKEMDRKEFIASIGAAALTVVGVTSVLKAFHLGEENRTASSGYGSSSYGGGAESVKRV